MTETPDIFPGLDMPKTTPDTSVKHHKTYVEMTYPEKKIFGEAICKKPRKKDFYETEMHKIYNLIGDQTNEKLQEKAALYTTFQEVKTGRDTIG